MMPVEWIPGSSALRETLETRQIGKSHGNKSCLQRRSLNLAQGKFMEGENLESSRENLRCEQNPYMTSNLAIQLMEWDIQPTT